MRYAVLGAAGFIGSHLVPRLKAEGHFVRAVDHRQVHSRRKLYGQAAEFRKWDLRDPAECHVALRNIDRVYHLAADHGGVGYFHSDADQPAALNNMQIDLNVLRACEENEVERLFYAGSACAYPTDLQDADYTRLAERYLYQGEAEQCYGMEKRMMTKLCDEGSLDARVGVFCTIYGPGQESEGIRAKFPTAITRRVLEAGGGKIELWGDGSQIRTFLYITDALDRITRIMEDDNYSGPVNVASDEEVTVRQCADWVCEFAGIPQNYDFRMDMPTGAAARAPDNTKAQALYGPLTQVSAKDGFRKLYDSMRHGTSN